MAIKLLVGLGNPGPEYSRTRHNAGAWLIETLAKQEQQALRFEAKFQSLTAAFAYQAVPCRLLIPTTFMNRSGLAVKSIVNFYRFSPDELLIIHDELDLAVGCIRLKYDGGHGGHNGLRDIIAHLGTTQFYRMRIGIDRPASSKLVSDYVLKPPTKEQYEKIETAIAESIEALPLLLNGEMAKAMQMLNSK